MKLFIMTNTKLRLRKNKFAKVRNYYLKNLAVCVYAFSTFLFSVRHGSVSFYVDESDNL